MKLGIIGLPGSGKTTVFRALTGGEEAPERKGHQEPGIGVVKVDDERLDFLSAYHKPKKVTPVHVEFLDIGGLTGEGQAGRELGDRILSHIRPVDALVHTVRFFKSGVLGAPNPLKEMERIEEEMLLSDLAVVEKRLVRLESDFKKGRKEAADEMELLKEAQNLLDQGKPLRFFPPALESDKLRGFAFLTAKPELFLVNAGEDKTQDEIRPLLDEITTLVQDQPHTAVDWLYADTEAEIARLDPEEAKEFLEDLQLDEEARTRIVKASFRLLDLIVFFTVLGPEVRAWPLKNGKNAWAAAGTVHTDMQRGFIRAEVVAFNDFKQAGSTSEAHKAGKIRLEGKEYPVKDGDIIHFRFNV